MPELHDVGMRIPWHKPKDAQLDLLDAEPGANALHQATDSAPRSNAVLPTAVPIAPGMRQPGVPEGRPMQVATALLYEGANNPRTELPDAELDELAEDIRQHGILQAIVVHPADDDGRHRIHFGAKRWRAAQRIRLQEVPVVIRDAPADPYTQVAENQKRHGLTPLDLARFIRGRVDGGESNAAIAKRLGMSLTTVAHHLALLDLPPELDEALKSGRCTSPRTLHELSKLHEERPEHVRALMAGDAEITRAAVAAMRADRTDAASGVAASSPSSNLIAQANAACDRLEQALGRIKPPATYQVASADLVALRARVADLATRWLQGSDRQTP